MAEVASVLPVAQPVVKASRAAFATGAAPILRDLDFELSPGEWTFVVGPAGSGKTTLLRLAAGDLEPTSGAIDRTGDAELVLHETPLDDTQSARDLVAAAMTGGDAAARAESLLGDLGLDTYLNHEPFRLSRGHRRRLEIACALAAKPALLCLDDPFSPMDGAARAKTAVVLRDAARETGLAILMVSNHAIDALRYGDRIMLISPGPAARIVANHANTPRPDATADELESSALFDEVEGALWDESA